MVQPLWTPAPERVQHSNMHAFMRYVEKIADKPILTYNDLYEWSIANIEEFWKSIWIISGVIHSNSYTDILENRMMPGAKWFIGARLNFAENLLKYRDDRTAIISSREDAPTYRITYSQLYKYVASAAKYLIKSGVIKGDRVAGFISNIPEAIIAMLAAASIGAVWTSCSPDFGLQGVLDRFGQTEPKILFAVESYKYNGKTIECTDKIKSVLKNIPQIKKTILIPRINDFNNTELKNNSDIPNSLYFNSILNYDSTGFKFEQLPFDHPVYIMYSSGTTGKPKCIVHGAGGTLLQHFKELSLHTNLKREDVIMYYTTCGWMMWNWLVSSLNIGAAIFLYDGNPAYPDASILWRKIEEEKISIFGTSPKYLTFCEKTGIIPKEKFNLSSLKTILSTGSPLSVDNFKWVYRSVKNELQLSSISGGTDIISCFMLGCPILPVYAGEIQCRGLGMAVKVFNEAGEPVESKKGELVCTEPFPSMPIYFWNDPDGKKYKAAYFEDFPGVWRHGDFIKLTEHGGIIVYGRSDATLNPGGVRIGTAEIYKSVESMDEILDSIVIGQEWNNDIRIILFVVVKDGYFLDKDLKDKIKLNIRNSTSPRHVPSKIIQITEVPRTISGKKVELAVNRIVHNKKVENREALSNPGSLDQFKNITELLN